MVFMFCIYTTADLRWSAKDITINKIKNKDIDLLSISFLNINVVVEILTTHNIKVNSHPDTVTFHF